ncbi:MAG: tRNA guanosine(34) transglycosylase Tgt [Vulcanimicrobiaceae bacterium]
MANFKLDSTDGGARLGTLQVEHGTIATPTFMPVGTAATVKALTPRDLREIKSQIVLANAYHLWLRPGRDVLVEAGGLHRFMCWDGPLLTDSGGFQVFSLESRRKVDAEGVTFSSHIDGAVHRFTPENVLEFQEAIGVDIAMILDVCVKLPAERAELETAVRRTSEWARRAAHARSRPETALFGIVQGGLDEALRERSAAAMVELHFDGYAIGGLSVGETRADMYRMARFSAALLPSEQPRYLMGVGTVRDLIEAVDCGIDMFDCVYPTRCGRNGRAMTSHGDLNIRNAEFTRDFRPIDAACDCSVCTTFTRAYLAHLFRANEMLGPHLLSYHNVYLLNRLMEETRAAIAARTWTAFRDARLAHVAA